MHIVGFYNKNVGEVTIFVSTNMCNWLEISNVLTLSVSRKVCNIGLVHSNFFFLLTPVEFFFPGLQLQ